jgi:hypothetical protein
MNPLSSEGINNTILDYNQTIALDHTLAFDVRDGSNNSVLNVDTVNDLVNISGDVNTNNIIVASGITGGFLVVNSDCKMTNTSIQRTANDLDYTISNSGATSSIIMRIGSGNSDTSFDIRNSSDGVLFGVKGDGSIDIGALTLTSAEVQQLATIGSNTISSSQWGYLSELNQSLTDTSNPTFNSVLVSGLTGTRLVGTDGGKGLSSVGLASFLTAQTDEINVVDSGFGSVALSLSSSLKLQTSNLRIGSSTSENKISFYGTTSDNLGGYDHTVIAERLYNGVDQSELLLFKGSGGVGVGHDKIRLRCSGDILFQTAASGEVYGTLANNTTRATISSSDGTVTCTSHIVSYGDIYNIFDNVGALGRNTRRFTEVWSVDGTINTSDLNSKENISDSDLGLDFINRLRPISYKWKDYSTTDTGMNGDIITNRTYVRRHYGLISQEVGTVLSDISKPTNDFGGYIATAEGTYALRYTEFICPIMKAIQELSSSLTAALARIQVLEDL